MCLPDGSYELEFTAPAGWGDDAGDDATGSDESCAEVVGPNGGSHSGCVSGSDDEGDTSFTAVGGVVHDDAPTSVPTPQPTVQPSTAALLCTYVADEGTSDASIGTGWSDTAVTDYPNYGYVHGNCALCDEGAGRYGFMSSSGMSKTFATSEAHSHLRVMMRVWAVDTWNDENIYLAADGVTVWDSGGLYYNSCSAGWTEWASSSRTAPEGDSAAMMEVELWAATRTRATSTSKSSSRTARARSSLASRRARTMGAGSRVTTSFGLSAFKLEYVDADGAPAGCAPTSVPTPLPSPECPGGESLYKLLLTDGASDGWEGATYRVVDADGTIATSGTLDDGGSGLEYVCLPDGSYELEFTAPAGWGDDADDAAAGGDESCAEVVGPNGGSHSGCVSGSDDEVDTSFTAVGGVVHDDAPTPVPSPAPTLNPSPECPGGESLYKLLLTDGASDGWEGATYRVVDADGTVAASGTLSDGGSDLEYVCLPDGSYELEFTAPAGWGDDADDGSAVGDESCAEVAGSNGGSHSGCVSYVGRRGRHVVHGSRRRCAR